MASKQQQILNKVSEVIAESEKFFKKNVFENIKFEVRFDLKGASAGIAGYKIVNGERHYYVRFNVDMIYGDHFEEILNETISHEMAHIFCFITGYGKGHDAHWKYVCRVLGGSGERCHKLSYTPARKTRKFIYETTCGKKITVGLKAHNNIQMGKKYTVQQTGGYLIASKYQQV